MSGDASGSTILVVEDEAIIRMLVVDHLSDLGYSLIEAGTAKQALNALEGDASIGLMLADVGLPDRDGRELAEIARRDRPDLRILFATGDAGRITSWGGYTAGAMGLVGKPFDLDELARAVAELLDRPT